MCDGLIAAVIHYHEMLSCEPEIGYYDEPVPLSAIEPTLQPIRKEDFQPLLQEHNTSPRSSAGDDDLSKLVHSTIACPQNLPPQNSPAYNVFIMQLIYADISNTCLRLGIPEDPAYWSSAHVSVWIRETLQLRGLSPLPSDLPQRGCNLYCMSLDDFRSAYGSYGDILKSCFDLWVQAVHHCKYNSDQSFDSSGLVNGYRVNEPKRYQANQRVPRGVIVSTPDSCGSAQDEPCSSGSSTIHLWQFIRHLLENPADTGQCVRWLSRSQGIFKIENSSALAKLWGKRKNRPAMNYDKLSRSLRQYYKKGILQKTPRSQRLIYQFCPAYRY